MTGKTTVGENMCKLVVTCGVVNTKCFPIWNQEHENEQLAGRFFFWRETVAGGGLRYCKPPHTGTKLSTVGFLGRYHVFQMGCHMLKNYHLGKWRRSQRKWLLLSFRHPYVSQNTTLPYAHSFINESILDTFYFFKSQRFLFLLKLMYMVHTLYINWSRQTKVFSK